ncbi:hypothetical protein [Limnohabitans sp.]|uniref:hypothetical protein n=1 Tax=Limnohabitans sp. TaxID=1907725 RepID=UPI00311D8093
MNHTTNIPATVDALRDEIKPVIRGPISAPTLLRLLQEKNMSQWSAGELAGVVSGMDSIASTVWSIATHLATVAGHCADVEREQDNKPCRLEASRELFILAEYLETQSELLEIAHEAASRLLRPSLWRESAPAVND